MLAPLPSSLGDKWDGSTCHYNRSGTIPNVCMTLQMSSQHGKTCYLQWHRCSHACKGNSNRQKESFQVKHWYTLVERQSTSLTGATAASC